MVGMDECSIDAIVADGPYALSFMQKAFDTFESPTAYYEFTKRWATEALRVLKPGGSLLSFGGTRTFHRLTCGLEDSGFIIKDCLMWLYGQGFPKAQDLGKMIDKRLGAEREVDQVISGPIPGNHGGSGHYRHGEDRSITLPASDLARHWDGYKIGGIKPAWESILWAQKPWSDCDIIKVLVRNLLINLEVMQCLINEASTTDLDYMAQIIPHGRAGDLSEVTDTPCGKSTESSISNTVSLWRNCLVGLSKGASKSTTSTNDGMITDLRTCDSLLSATIQVCTNQGGINQNGGALSVANAVHTLTAVYMKHKDILTTFAQENVTSSQLEEALSTSDGSPARPNWLPIVWAVKPPEGAWIDNVLKYGTGAVNVDETRIGTTRLPTSTGAKDFSQWRKLEGRTDLQEADRDLDTTKGRFPANLLLSHTPDCREVGTKRVKGTGGTYRRDASDEKQDRSSYVVPKRLAGTNISHADPDGYETIPAWECAEDCPVRLLDEQSGPCGSTSGYVGEPTTDDGGKSWRKGEHAQFHYSDSGGSSRFFYTSKATDRQDYNDHPTLKPTDLIEWLIRLVTRPGQLVLDPFMGSGTTLVAAIRCGREAVGIEQDRHYCDIAERRIKGTQMGMF